MIRSFHRLLPVLAAGLLLSACTTVGTQKIPPPQVAYSIPPAAERAEAARVQALRAIENWGFQGRVAVSNGKQGGSGRLEWRQDGNHYQARLSAPVTRQSWVLEGQPGAAVRLEGLGDGPREGADARLLLLEATGWDIPVDGLSDWVRGLLTGAAGQEGLQRDVQGRPRRLQHDGWDVQYLEWYPQADGMQALPRRLEASRGQARVRLVLDQWDMPSP